ncbi:MAG TPA: PP2C family protein-serine/threonine phosphatase [Solirubrobacteraceae bacterium]|nr:PP2C family protein-serine/threonine phosphatase [Solirubrobacteraceae bacterium]
MGGRGRPGLNLGGLLAAVENAPPVAAADVVGELLAETLDAFEVAFLIADFGGDAVIRLSHTRRLATSVLGREIAERVPLGGSAHGRALASQAVSVEEEAGGWRVLAPVTNRGEAIGILELLLDDEPDEQCAADVALAAHALAYIVIANRRFTDLFEWGQRSVPLSLAAEIQHRLLPAAYTCEAAQFALAAWLEPAGEIAGDTFDFSLERDTLHLSLTDAMGHSLEAAILATVLVGALRNGRRAGLEFAEQAGRASAGLAEHFHGSEYVTGQLARIDLRTGRAEVVNAGHPPPLRLRDGRVSHIDLEPDLPFGWGEHSYRVQPLPLVPGDRVVFLTDGLVERNGPDIDIQALVAQGAEMHPREAVQHLIRAVVKGTKGHLKDDATVMCLDWHGGSRRLRTSDSGADN